MLVRKILWEARGATPLATADRPFAAEGTSTARRSLADTVAAALTRSCTALRFWKNEGKAAIFGSKVRNKLGFALRETTWSGDAPDTPFPVPGGTGQGGTPWTPHRARLRAKERPRHGSG